ncbi:hypothetical protein [Reichenbachiella agariperforans]|uniref:hypothetical protein n=1 Tax=Reichenbachiella agariperforans TaxID=156994 RepID=UPI001C08C920|nr:hypothetical protein [Reichenbachiella agariperforans]MBU2912744.1 hypothetical protein [Reichenbachiella agariperforans]
MRILLTMILLMTLSVVGFSQELKAQEQTEQRRKKPKTEYRVGSAVITVWVNTRKDGKTWKNFQVKKIYKKDDKWLSSNSFSETELLELKAVIDKAINEEIITIKE